MHYTQADVDKSGTIDYIEFITVTMHRHRLESEENLHRAFNYFDKDGSGYVFIFYFSFLGHYHAIDSSTFTLFLASFPIIL